MRDEAGKELINTAKTEEVESFFKERYTLKINATISIQEHIKKRILGLIILCGFSIKITSND